MPLPKKISARALCFDIDETFSSSGKITPEAFSALWALRRAKKILIPVTGRPAGWCDHIARFWPVDAVVGENGAFCMWMESGTLRRAETPGALMLLERNRKLDELRKALAMEFPEIRWASDQAYRDHDLAIDIAEDVPRWADARIEALLEFCKSKGAHAKLSSIHVNTWFGDFDKAQGLRHLFESGPRLLRPFAKPGFPNAIYVGDSPNDAPLFGAFRQSVGVANLKAYLKTLPHLPTWITRQKSGAGFVELAQALGARAR